MKSALLAVEEEAYPNRYRWPVATFHQLVDIGFLEGRFEILDGEVISKSGQNPTHRIALIHISEVLFGLFGVRNVQSEKPITLTSPDCEYSEPTPDIAVARKPTTAYSDRNPSSDDLLLVVEVSAAALRTDLLVKSRLYARASIEEYWVLDLIGRQLHIHRQPTDGEYKEITVYKENDTVALISHPNARITAANLFPPANG